MFTKHPLITSIAAALTLCGSTQAGPEPVAGKDLKEPTKEQSIFDKIWAIPVIYSNKENTILQEFRFTGRLHGDVFSQDSDLGYEQDWILRRWRMGAKAKMFGHLDLHVEVDLNGQDPTPLYGRLTDAYLAWTFCEAAKVTVGKQSVKFTLDGATSSNELVTIDRNNIANNFWFPTEYVSGVSLSGKIGNWQYNTGYFSGGTETNEFGNFDEGHFWLGSIGYDFGKTLGVKKALLRADYVYNDRNAESNATRSFENIGSISFQVDAGRWGFSAEGVAATGYGTQSAAHGVSAMPWFKITDKLQAVARYTYISSDDPNGIRHNRYENVATGGRGDEYNEVYGGLNYYIYGHKLKVQTGLSYVWMSDEANNGGNYNGWTWTSGFRLSF